MVKKAGFEAISSYGKQKLLSLKRVSGRESQDRGKAREKIFWS
jgi:hypothetical protein